MDCCSASKPAGEDASFEGKEEASESKNDAKNDAKDAFSFETATSALISLKRQSPPENLRPLSKKTKTNDLVAKCADFTAALKKEHPPGSPVFSLFQKFVTSQRDAQGVEDHKKIILELVALLKPTPSLLKKFFGLLPKWCFNSTWDRKA